MARTARLSGKDNVIAGLGTAGNAGLGNDKAIFTDFNVVTQVDQIIDFSTSANLRRPQGRIVLAGAGANFDVVTEDDVSDLRNAGMLPFFRGKAETFAADDGMGPDDGIFAEDAVFVDDGAGIEDRAFANFDMVT